jgi:hypothetical protein
MPNFIDLNTIITSGVTLLVGFFAFILYRIEKNDKDKSSANLVLEEIRTIETNIDKLKENGNLLGTLPANLSTSGWFAYRNILVKHLDFYEISQAGLFFERIEALKDLLNQWRVLYFSTMQEKSFIVQNKLAEFAIENKDYEEKTKYLHEKFEAGEYWFEPFLYKKQINSLLSLISPISTTTIGEKIKNIGRKKWYSLRIKS